MERLEDIHHYLSEQEKAPQAARETLTRILSREYQMRSMPQSGRVVPGYNIPNLRELLEGSYRIIYFVHDTHVLVVSVMHQSRILSKVRALNTAVNEIAKAQQKKPTEK